MASCMLYMSSVQGYNTGYKYKGQHLLRPPSGQQQPRTQVHLTSEERAEMEQFQQERQARNAERKKRRRQQQDRRSKEAEPRKQGGTGLEDDAQVCLLTLGGGHVCKLLKKF